MLAPPLLEVGDEPSGGVEHFATFRCREDQLCATIARVRSPLEVAAFLQLVDELGARRQTEVRPFCERGQPDALDADVPPHLQVDEAQVQEATFALPRSEQVGAEPVEQPNQDLSDGQPIGGQCP